MFGKLMKYENRKLSKYMLPLFAASTVASVVMALMLWLFIGTTETSPDENFLSILLLMGSMILAFVMWMVIVAANSGSYILLGVRFYKNFISDEGYLTFTLPVTAGQLLGSKTLSAFIWRILSTVVFIINMIIVCLGFILPMSDKLNDDLLADLKFTFAVLGDAMAEAFTAGEVVMLVISLIFFVIVMELLNLGVLYLAITLGGVMAQKHKALAGIGLYMVLNTVISTVVQIVYSIFSALAMFTDGMSGEPSLFAISLFLLISAALCTAFTCIIYFIIRYLLGNKLNLA